MMGPKHDESRHATAIVRDVVEVVAIVLAGIWALYTFVYEERIKPAGEPASIVVTGSLQRQAERNGLVELAYDVTLKNTGSTRVYIAAAGFAADGIRFTASPLYQRRPDGSFTEYDRDAHMSYRRSVYRVEQFTKYANKSFTSGYDIGPGEEVPYSGFFAVRRSDYDEVVMYASIAYGKLDKTYPTRSELRSGAIIFSSANHDPELNTIEVALARTSLW